MRLWYLLTGLAVFSAGPALAETTPLKVGVTLHPYYSWTANIVQGTPVELRSILPGEVDAGNYQPRPDDIKKLADLDAIVINGVGHDDFIQGMIEASGNKKIVIIRPNDGAPMIRAMNGGSRAMVARRMTPMTIRTNARLR